MKIRALTTFLHGKMRFEDGLDYTVPDALGTYFISQKWATSAATDARCFTVPDHMLGADAEPAKHEGASLDIHDAVMTMNSEVK
jgi:hypothetical protein